MSAAQVEHFKKALLAKLINRYKLSSLTFCYRSELVSYNMSDFLNFMSFFFLMENRSIYILSLKKTKTKKQDVLLSVWCFCVFLNIHLYIESFWGDSILHNSGLFVARQQEVLHVTEDLSLLQLLQRFRPIVPAVWIGGSWSKAKGVVKGG